MRKIYITILSCFFILASLTLNAQVNAYVFTAGTGGTLEDMTTGTTQVIGTGSDDGISAVTNIGFNFTFNGTVYTQFSVSANGLLRFGPAAVTNQWDNLEATNGFIAPGSHPKLAVYYDDLATGGGTVGKVHYKIVGAAPAKLVVEWVVTVPRSLGGTANATFQAWLEEGSNRVTFVYGAGMVANTINGGYTIGIASSPTDFQSITAATNTASIVTHNGTQTSAITSGTIYNFFPPPPCASPFNVGTVTGPSAPVCPGSNFSLAVSGASFGTFTYQWQTFDGAIWNDIPGATGQTLTTSISATTTYRRKMTCGVAEDFTASFQVNVAAPVSTFPWTENFDGLGSIGTTSFPNCWFKQNGDWQTANTGSTTLHDPRSAPNYLVELWSAINEYVWTNGFQLTAGTSYDFSFWFAADGTAGWVGDVFMNNVQNSAGATQMGGSFITAAAVPPAGVYAEVKRTFVPATTGVYYFAIRVNAPFAPNVLAFDDFRMELTPPCSAPAGLSVANLTNVSVTLDWLASVTPPAGGYEWELRTAGAGGSGAAGLAFSGSTAAGVLTANQAGLTPNTQYSLYVRSACSPPTLYSAWSNAFVFRTLCSTISTFPYTETFEPASISRTCWISTPVSGSTNWTLGAGAGNGGTITAAHNGAVNAQYFGNGTGSVARFVSPALDFSGMNPAFGAQVTFWYANENWAGDQNELRVYYKTSAAGTWTLIPGAVYTTNVGVWTEVELLLPSSTTNDYYIAFEGTELFGWGVAIDDITIGAAPTCPKPTAVTTVGISPTSMVVTFTAPVGAYVVEYGPVGFVPGTTNVAGGGTIVLTPGSPITITDPALVPGTTYDVYVRRICIPGADYSLNVKTTATTLCAATNIPYLQDMETATPVTGFPTCTSMEDVNGNSGPIVFAGGGRWLSFTGGDPSTYVSPTKVVRYIYDAVNLARPADDWFYIQGLNLTGGTSYRLKFYMKGSDGPIWTERLEVKYGTAAYSAAMTNTLYTNNNIISSIATPWDSAIVDFTPATTGVYYIGFHTISAADQAFLYLDDVSVKITPLVDVGPTGITAPTCPTNTGIPVTIRNYNITPQDFATYPVTVTANITGAVTTTINTTINSTTLAPGASTTVSLPGFNVVPGLYNITVTTSSPDDPETANDSYTTSFFVNPSPTAAVITPATPAICAGDSIELRTQFTVAPPAPTTMPLVSSGAINLPIPDANLTPATHTLAIAGVPANATVTNITVILNATHTWVSDLRFNLRAPNGRILTLVNRRGGFFEANLVNTAISSTSTTPMPATGAPFTGTFMADGTAPVAGQGPGGFASNASSFAPLLTVPNGNWTLAVNDNALFDNGTLDSWSISITYGFPHPVVTWSPVTGLFTNSATTTAYDPIAAPNATSVYAEPATTTTYTVTSTNPITGCTSTNTVTVTVNQLPVVNFTALPTKICLSDTAVALNATPTGGTWSGIGVSGNNFLPPRTAVGTYNLTYTYIDPIGCRNTGTISAKVEDCPERIILLRDNAVVLFPNPNNGQFNIRINSVLYNKLTMRVYNGSGSLVSTQQFSGLVFNRVVPINLTHLPGGAYMVQFSYEGGVRTSEKTFKVLIGH